MYKRIILKLSGETLAPDASKPDAPRGVFDAQRVDAAAEMILKLQARGIQVGVVYLIFSAGIKMGKSLPKTARNRVILIAVLIGMTGCTLCAVSFSSVYYILICGALGLLAEWIHRLQAKEAARK